MPMLLAMSVPPHSGHTAIFSPVLFELLITSII
jgi:hypothetical protein